jgi:hypothetical protein
MVLIRFALISLIIYMIVRAFIQIGEESTAAEKNGKKEKKNPEVRKKISKQIGEYVDYEEVKKR